MRNDLQGNAVLHGTRLISVHFMYATWGISIQEFHGYKTNAGFTVIAGSYLSL
jgi:hypothetical protein